MMNNRTYILGGGYSQKGGKALTLASLRLPEGGQRCRTGVIRRG